MLDRLLEERTRLVEVVAGVEHAIDLRAVTRPLLQLIEVALVCFERIVGLFVGQVAHSRYRGVTRSVFARRWSEGTVGIRRPLSRRLRWVRFIPARSANAV